MRACTPGTAGTEEGRNGALAFGSNHAPLYTDPVYRPQSLPLQTWREAWGHPATPPAPSPAPGPGPMAGEGPAARPGGARPPARDAEAAMRRHRERHAFLARRRGAPLPAPAAAAAEVKLEDAEAEEVVICKLERAVEAAEAAPAAAAVVGGKRRREGAAEAGPSRRGATQ